MMTDHKSGATTEDKIRYRQMGDRSRLLEQYCGRWMRISETFAVFVWDSASNLNNARGILLKLFVDKKGNRLLHLYQDTLFRWVAQLRMWEVMPDEVLKNLVWEFLDRHARTWEEDVYDFKPVVIRQPVVNEILAAIRGLLFLDTFGTVPPFIVKGILPLPNHFVGRTKTVDLITGQSFDTTPAVFALNRLPFDLDSKAEPPERWMRFLDEAFPRDQESIDTLQEWFGYVISGRTDMQKALFIIGPKRSGKGTICNVLKELVGAANYGATSLAQIGGRFGLAGLMHMSVAVMSDVRVGKLGASTTERILTITGEDTVAVERKNQADVHVKLGVRLMMTSNELPQFAADDSGALVSRLLTIEMTESFYGREDRGMLEDLRAELPGIMRWAVEGLRRINHRGRFTEPESGKDVREQLGKLSSPIGAWLEERCDLGEGYETDADVLRDSFRTWCAFNRREAMAPNTFGVRLKTATGGRVAIAGRDGNRRRVYVGVRLRESGCDAGAGMVLDPRSTVDDV